MTHNLLIWMEYSLLKAAIFISLESHLTKGPALVDANWWVSLSVNHHYLLYCNHVSPIYILAIVSFQLFSFFIQLIHSVLLIKINSSFYLGIFYFQSSLYLHQILNWFDWEKSNHICHTSYWNSILEEFYNHFYCFN